MHQPVLLQQAVNNLSIKPGGLYIDATIGEGGHSQEIIKLGGKVLGIDLDKDQIAKLKDQKLENLILVNGNFKDIEQIAKKNNFYPVDGILFDLGLSMNQIEKSGRGFSFKNLKEDLDMRIDTSLTLSAGDLLNRLSEDELYEIFAKYSEDLNSRVIAQEVVFRRRRQKIKKVADLIKIIDRVLKTKDEKTYRRIFQALRMAVNDEKENLKTGLVNSLKVLRENGRLVVITFQSLEDRLVKNFIRENNLKQLNKKIIKSDSNWHFERSAKMRVIINEKKNEKIN